MGSLVSFVELDVLRAFLRSGRYLLHGAPLPDGHWAHQLRRNLPRRVLTSVDKLLPRAQRQHIRIHSGDLIGSDALIDDFVQAIAGSKVPCVSGAEGLQDLKIVHAAYQALESGQPVSLSRPRVLSNYKLPVK